MTDLHGHDVKYGRRVRRTYSRVQEVLDLPNLIEIQQRSYEWFLREGLKEMFDDISPKMDSFILRYRMPPPERSVRPRFNLGLPSVPQPV